MRTRSEVAVAVALGVLIVLLVLLATRSGPRSGEPSSPAVVRPEPRGLPPEQQGHIAEAKRTAQDRATEPAPRERAYAVFAAASGLRVVRCQTPVQGMPGPVAGDFVRAHLSTSGRLVALVSRDSGRSGVTPAARVDTSGSPREVVGKARAAWVRPSALVTWSDVPEGEVGDCVAHGALQERPIEGTVEWPDGTPAAGVQIQGCGETEGRPTDEEGRFSLSVVADWPCRVRALDPTTWEAAWSQPVRGTPVHIVLEEREPSPDALTAAVYEQRERLDTFEAALELVEEESDALDGEAWAALDEWWMEHHASLEARQRNEEALRVLSEVLADELRSREGQE